MDIYEVKDTTKINDFKEVEKLELSKITRNEGDKELLTGLIISGFEMKFGKISGGVKKYDAALYLRGKPLKDPFYAVRSYDSKRENEEAPQMPVAEGTTGTIHLAPVLQGVMEYGGNRRAMLAVNGESVTVRKGDRVGIWSVVSIGEKTVQLSSAAGNLFLELP